VGYVLWEHNRGSQLYRAQTPLLTDRGDRGGGDEINSPVEGRRGVVRRVMVAGSRALCMSGAAGGSALELSSQAVSRVFSVRGVVYSKPARLRTAVVVM
jgi:hypothetical protein